MIETAVRRVWRQYADIRRRTRRSGSAASSLASFGNADRRNVRNWMDATADGHDRYRAQHPVPSARVAIVCVSRRPHLLGQVVQNVAAQSHRDLDFVFVANAPEFDAEHVRRSLDHIAGVQIQVPAAGTSLGTALNEAMEATDARFVAKFDDDDLYGPNYIADALRAHAVAGAGIVGKHSYYAHLAESDRTVLRFPGHEFSYGSTLAGGTLVIDRDVVGDQQFPDVSIGEDRAFLARCHRRGISTYSADRFNFVQIRSADNTWTLPDADFLVDTIAVDHQAEAFR